MSKGTKTAKRGQKNRKMGPESKVARFLSIFCIGRLQKKALKAPEEITWKQLFKNLSKSSKRLKNGLGNEVKNMTNKAGSDQEPF